MINIDELKYNFDKPFLDLMEGIEIMIDPIYGNVIILHKNNECFFKIHAYTYFQQKDVGINESSVVVSLQKHIPYSDIKEYVKYQMNKFFNTKFGLVYYEENLLLLLSK